MIVDNVSFNPIWVAKFETVEAFQTACQPYGLWPRLTEEARNEKLKSVYEIIKNVTHANSSGHDGELAEPGCEQPDTAKPNGRKDRNGRAKQATDVEGADSNGATD